MLSTRDTNENDGVTDGSLVKRLLSSNVYDYENAIYKLNKLQSNAETQKLSERENPQSHVYQVAKVETTTKCLSKIGISLKTLDTLSIIHIAGTKGKGTTAALCESILRHHGYRTGFFSSPHLVAVRERIRIDGVPLSQLKFANYFNLIYDQLEEKKENDKDMPSYFKFLTVMAFHVFLAEQVDVAIVEVGLGGEYDCTNCIRKPAVVGIASLGLDHTQILGKTLPDIAWQKSGIFKPGAKAFTVPQSSPDAMDILRDRALNRQCSLFVSPTLDCYAWDSPNMAFTHMVEDVYATNASLALQISNAWLKLQSPFNESADPHNDDTGEVRQAEPFSITAKMAEGLTSCCWPGRTQVLQFGAVTYFLDGAHTEESIDYCIKWFLAVSSTLQPEPDSVRRILIFNVTGHRRAEKFLKNLSRCNFQDALFPEIIAFRKQDDSSDHYSKNTPQSATSSYSHIWQCMTNGHSEFFETVSEAIDYISKSGPEPCHVLITGSVYLVGSALSVLDPTLNHPVTRIPVSLRPLQSVYSTLQAIL